MVQFNLLPDVKIKYITARRKKRSIMLGSFMTGVGSLGLVALMALYVYLVQGAQIALLNKEIKDHDQSIKTKRSQVDDINKVLTVQNQLDSLDVLHEGKPIVSRTLTYLSKLKPQSVTITKVDVAVVDGENVMTLEGETQLLESVNTFVDTLKFSEFIKEEGEDPEPVFTSVVLQDFSRDKEKATYTISMNYDPIIFSGKSKETNLIVPKDFISTRSALEVPIIQDGLINTESDQGEGNGQ